MIRNILEEFVLMNFKAFGEVEIEEIIKQSPNFESENYPI